MNEIVLTILEILKYTVPSGIVFATAFFMLRQFFIQQRSVEMLKVKADSKSDMLPTRLQAYERLILFLERIEPTNLIVRVHTPTMNAQLFHRELLKNIRNEYEHNLAQQLYVSNASWKHVNDSKDAVVQLINLAAKSVNDNAPAIELSNTLFEIVAKAGVSPTASALQSIKNEAHQLL